MTCASGECIKEAHASCYDQFCPDCCALFHGATCIDFDDDTSDLDAEFYLGALIG